MLYLESMGFISPNHIFKIINTNLKDLKCISYINQFLWKAHFYHFCLPVLENYIFYLLGLERFRHQGNFLKNGKKQKRSLPHTDSYWPFKSYFPDNEILRVNGESMKHFKIFKILLHPSGMETSDLMLRIHILSTHYKSQLSWGLTDGDECGSSSHSAQLRDGKQSAGV